ncbi:MAG: hypothetical protein I3274_06265 [Candidatus Moeniiplasma glomeromycotorum]|nr:hypothetical protein [Candidatus Moeniiplasma glomeromycotorum]
MLNKESNNLRLLKVLALEKKIEEEKKKKGHWENAFSNAIIGLLSFLAVAGFFFLKKPEYWLYCFLIFIGLSLFALILIIVGYNQYKKSKKQIEKLEKELYLLKKRN